MTEDRREGILRKVQALLAKAMSTPFEGEADVFRAKANELMDTYRIEQWEIAKREQGSSSVSSLKPVRKSIPITWWWDEKTDTSSALWMIFMECTRTCAVVVANMHLNPSTKSVMAYGLESDIAFLQMLFTDLHIQMSNKISPKFDPDKSLGENVYNAKEAGMKYGQIAKWCGHPEWITIKGYSKRGYPQYQYNGIMIREMKKYAAAAGLDIHKEISLDSYIEDFIQAYSNAVRGKLKMMRGDAGETGSMALAIRDITDLAREMMYEDFPDDRPHPEDCDCDYHHRCNNINCTRPGCHERQCQNPDCQRATCKERRKPIRFRKSDYRSINPTATARGARAGSEARIMGRQEGVTGKSPKPLN